MITDKKQRGISRAAVRRWNQESDESQIARYNAAMEQVHQLREMYEAERNRKIAIAEQRQAILAEREAAKQAQLEATKRAEAVRDTVPAPQAIDSTVTKQEQVDGIKPKTEGKKDKSTQSFFTSLWMNIVDILGRPAGTPQTYNLTSTVYSDPNDIKRRQFQWTPDAVAAYNIQKNKVEIDKYVGDITANKEKMQYAGIIDTYADNAQEYIKIRSEYDQLLTNNSQDAIKRRNELSQRMQVLQKWNTDLDDQMKVAMSYDMTYGSPLSGISSYEASIGAPRRSGDALQENGRDLYNQYKRLLSKPQIDPRDLTTLQQSINRVKKGVSLYGDKINKENAIATQKMDEEYKDLREWEEWHTPSAEFRAKEKAAQSNYLFDWDTYAYSFPGTLGSSMSFGGTQLLSTALNMAGGVAIQTGNPYLVGAGVASTLVGAGLGIVSGINENKSEIGSNYTDVLREDLQNNGLLADFVKKGEEQLKKKKMFYHKDEEDKIQDILNYFVRGDISYNDQRINDIATKHLFGANNLFQNDMMAVSADVAFDTGLNLFMPAGSVAKALKIAPVGKFNNYTRTLAAVSNEHPLIGNIIRRIGAVESGVGTRVLDAISPVAGFAYRAAKTAVPQLNKIHAGAEMFAKGMKKGVKNLTSFITNTPASTFKLNTIGKGVLTFGGMSLMRGFSEAIEEGKQYKYGERFKNGGFAGKSNSILETLADDFSTGTSAALAFFGSQFLGLESDSELMSNMRGGFVGGLINHGTLITAYQQANNTVGEMKMGDLFMQNVMLQRIQERSEMINGQKFAKYATNPNKLAQMNAAIDRMIDISERYQEEAENNPEQQYWTKEDIETQRELFNRIVSVANNGLVQQSLKNQGIDIDSERGNALISLISYGLHKRKSDNEIYNDHIRQFNNLIDQDRLSSDVVTNLRAVLEDIEHADENSTLTKNQVDYLRKIYDEIVEQDEKEGPKTNKKLNSRQRRKAQIEYRKGRLDRIVGKIKGIVENDKNLDASFAKHHALLKLKNELQSIPEDMRSRTQKNQLKSVEYQLETFLNSLSPMQKVLHQIQTEESLAELGKNRGFFQQMSAAFRTVALDKASKMQDDAFLSGLLGKDKRMVMDTVSATGILLDEKEQDENLTKELLKNISDSIKDKDTFEQKRDALIKTYLDSIKDDYKLFEQIRDNFQQASEILDLEGENELQQQAEHTRTIDETPQPQAPTLSYDEFAKREARKAKRRRWRENKRRRERVWAEMNDAWEEPENDELIRNTYDPVDMDELDEVEEQDDYSLGDYMAQFDDAWEEPWWDELTSEREAAEAEDAAFLEQYSKKNSLLEARRLELEQLMDKYSVGTVITQTDGNKRIMYAIIGQKYNEHTDTVIFALQRLKSNESPDKRYKTIWVSEANISHYTSLERQANIQFEDQPRSVNGVTVGKKYDILIEDPSSHLVSLYKDITVLDIDDELNVHFETVNNIPSQLSVDEFNKARKKFQDSVYPIKESINDDLLILISNLSNEIISTLQNSPSINETEIIKAVSSLVQMRRANEGRIKYSNMIDSFVEIDGVLYRKTKLSHLIGDIAVDHRVESSRKQAIISIFANNGINNAEHTLRLLEGWYNNTLSQETSEDQQNVTKILGKPIDATGANLHTNKIDLTPYVIMARQGHFSSVEMEHVAHLISREYDKPQITEQERLNNIISDIVRGEEIEETEFSTRIVEVLEDLRNRGMYIIDMPMTIVGENYTYENNLFIIDSLGNVRSLFFPVRAYDYVSRLNDSRQFAETDRQHALRPISYDRKSNMTESEWQNQFAKYTSSILFEYKIPSYRGVYQIPIQSKDGKITISDKHLIFAEDGERIEPLSKQRFAQEMQSIANLVQQATQLLNNNREILPFTACIEMLDFCDNSIRKFESGSTTSEEIRSVKQYLTAAINHMSNIVDAYNLQMNPVSQQHSSKPSGKSNTKAERLLPVIRNDVQKVQELVNNIDQYTRPGGYIQKPVRDTLEAFLRNEAMERYQEKLKGSQQDSDKALAQELPKLINIISNILQTYQSVIGVGYRVDPNTKRLQDNTLVLTDSNRLELGSILMRPDFANTCEIEIVYGFYDKVNKKVIKLDKRSNATGVGVYGIITYQDKTYSPILILPSHYMDQFNTVTEEGEQFIDSVIIQQNLGKVIATDVHRLIPNINYNGNMVPVTLNSVVKLSDQDLQKLTPRSSSVGMCKNNGKIFPLDSTEALPIGTLNADSAARNIGGLFYMLPFDFKEYQEGSATVPVRLLNAKLKDGDIDVILQILKDLKDTFDLTGTLNLYKEYQTQNGSSPFTNLQVLQFLSNFEQREDKCRIYINPDGTVKLRRSLNVPFGENINPSTSIGQKLIREFFTQSCPQVFNHVRILSGKLSDTNNDLYKKLASYIQINKTLSISPSLMFDEDDVFMNNDGFYGIGWAMRHGRVLTNAAYIYEPSVGIGDIGNTTDIPTGFYNPQPTAPMQPQETSKPQSGLDWLEQMISNAGNNEAVAHSTIVATDKKLDRDQALRNIRRMLGESFPVEIEDKILEVLGSGAQVVGECFEDSIRLSSLSAYGMEYHESFHRVVELLMKPKERDKIYEIYVKQHPQLRLSNTKEIAEHMAESFRTWMTQYKPETFKFTWNIVKLFNQIKNWISAIRRIGSFRLAYTYYKINTGAYANLKASQENINRFRVIFGKYAPMVVYNSTTDQNVELKNVTSISDYDAATETIARMIINEYLDSNNTIEVSDIDLSIEGIRAMNGYQQLIGRENRTAANRVFSELFDNWDNIKSEVIGKLKVLGIGIRQNKATGKISIAKSALDTVMYTDRENPTDLHTNEGAVAEMMDYISKESYEISRVKKIKDFIKFLLSSIEDSHYVEEGELDEDGKQIPQFIYEINDKNQYVDVDGDPIYYRNGRWECDKANGITVVGNQVKFKIKGRNYITSQNVYGFKKYLPFDEVYARLLADCHSINTISDLISLLQKNAEKDLMYKQVYDKVITAYNNLLYVDKEGFHHDSNGSLWRMIETEKSPIMVKVGEDKRPVQITEEVAMSTGKWYKPKNSDRYFYAADPSTIDLQYDWNNLALVVQLFNAVAGSKLNYKMVIATRDSNSSITYRVSDTDSGYTARKFTQSWYLSFISNKRKIDTIEHNGVLYHRTKDSQLFNKAHEVLSTITNAFVNPKGPTSRTGNFVYDGKVYNVYINTDSIKKLIVQTFNSIGISIDKKVFDHLLFSTFGDTGYTGLVRYFSQSADISGKSKGVNIEFFLKSIINSQKNGVFNVPLESGTFYMNSGVISQLADAKYSYSTIHKQLSVNAPGNNRYYVMSEKNTITLMTELIQDKDGQAVQDFTNCPYYTYTDPITGQTESTFILDAILSGNYKLVFDNFVGFKNEDIRGDQGSDYMQIQDAVDLISKITLLENDNMIFPVMSNKKSYGQLSLVDKNGVKKHIPGIRFISNPSDNTHTPYTSSGVPTLVSNVQENQLITNGTYSSYSFVFPDEVYDRLIKYAMMEYQTVKYGMKLVNEMPDEEKVDNLHKGNKKTKQSSAGICRFPRFYGVYKPEVIKDGQGNIIAVNRKFINFNDNNASDAINLQTAEREFFSERITNTERKAMINELLMIQLEKWLNHLEEVGIIRKRQGWRSIQNPFFRYESDVLDRNYINSIVSSQQQMMDGKKLSPQEAKSLAIVQLLMDVHIKHQISMEEIQRLYLGHPGEFDTEYDEETGRITNDVKALSKRAGGLASTGETNALGVLNVPTQYVCSEIDDYKIASPQIEEIRQAFNESEHRSTLFNTQVKQIDSLISNFNITGDEGENYRQLFDLTETLDELLESEEGGSENVAKLCNQIIKLLENEEIKNKNDVLANIRKEAKENICSELYNKQKDLTLEQVSNRLDKLGLLGGVQARVASYTQSYERSINVGDGASYISPKMCKNMLMQLGLFKGEVVNAFNYLERGVSKDILADAKACSVIMKAMLGTQKYTAYGYRMANGFPEFYYNKTALFPMFKQLCGTPKLRGVYSLMTKGEEPIDMLMFKSSVKVGGKGSQPLPEFTSAEEFRNFKPNTYKQSFRFLIKQLNTDPKDREKMAMGTQALKVIESVLNVYITDYHRRASDGTLSSTNIVSGRELRDEIMTCRKKIADIQIAKIVERFFDESGAKNEQEFVKWIKDALVERDVDADMLRSLQLNEDGTRKTKLSAMSDGGWVQSIVSTLINKECIDLNLPGNMFIQRSVFGMEGKVVSDKYVPSINNGQRLQMINEQGSMDAAISVDFFVEMFPKQLKGKSFKQQRQWLLDHNIIGSKAKALTVSYRIPTQAASSISALRFVDVIPVVRDTIVLPEEFTALTGSDFDIDKLFFSMKNLYLKDDGTISDEYEPGTLEFYQNLLVEDFIMLLQQDRNRFGNITIRSVDKDTQLGKSVAEEIMSGMEFVDPYDALSLWKQSQIKEQNRTGGEAVGPAALNNSSQNIGRLYDVHLANRGVVRQLGISDLSSDLDVDSQSVLGLLSAYITGAVDNAKDPWISTVGLNSYTYNLANTLARAGFGRSTLYFTSQPVVKALARIHAYSESSLFRNKQQTPYELEEQLKQQFEKDFFTGVQGGISQEAQTIINTMASPMARYIEQYRIGNISEQQEKQYKLINRSYAIIKAILGIDHNNPHKKLTGFTRINGKFESGSSIMRDVAIMYGAQDPSKALTDHLKRYTIDIEYNDANGNIYNEKVDLSTNEVSMYLYILNSLLEYPSKAVSDSVQYTKIDTKKQGKNTAEQYAYLHGYETLKSNRAFDASLNNMLVGSYIDSLTKDTIRLHQQLLKDEYIEALDPMINYYQPNWVNQFLNSCGGKVNAESVKSAVDGITSYIKYKYIAEYADQLGIKIKDLFIGESSIYNQLEEIKTSIRENPVLYKEYVDGDGNINNKLLDALEPAWIREKDFVDIKNAPKFVEVVQKEDDGGNSVNALRMSWDQMINDNKHKDIQAFAKRLVVYGFVTSGDISRPGTLFKYVPFSWRYNISKTDGMEKSYSQYISDFISDKNAEQEFMMDNEPQRRYVIPIMSERRNDTIYDEILLNNWNDPKLVPTVKENERNKKYYKTITLDKSVNNPDILIAAEMIVGQNAHGVVQHIIRKPSVQGSPRIVKVHKENHTTYNQEDFYFYRFYDNGIAVDRHGNVFTYPIYTLINPMGGIFYGNKILEYMSRQGLPWNDRDEFVDESKLAEIGKRISVWNDYINPEPPAKLSKRDWERISANSFLTSDSIGVDEDSALNLITISMALYDSFRKMAPDYTSDKYQGMDISKGGSKISYSNREVSREEMLNNPRTLYIFTDNTNRTSGSNVIDRNSKYYKRYGDNQNDLYYPNSTRAVARGLNNAMPISTQRFYDPKNNLVKETGRWTNNDIEKFKETVDNEFADIEFEWSSGNYDNIVILGNSLFDSNISDIKEEGPRSDIYDYLQSKLNGLFQVIDGVSNTEKYFYPGKPTLNSIPNWQPGSIYYAGVGSRETPQDVLDNMTELAKELENEGYVLRSGGAEGADKAFYNGVQNKKNAKIYFDTDIEHDVYGTAKTANSLLRETHPRVDKVGAGRPTWLLARDGYQVFGDQFDSPAAFIICWTNDGVTSYEQTSATTGGTGQAIRLASRKGIPVINMKDPNWRQQLDDVLQRNKPQETLEIWDGGNGRGPNANLSNLAERQFVLSDVASQRIDEIFPAYENGETVSQFMTEWMNGRKFHGVEQAFQLAKFAAMYVHVAKQKATRIAITNKARQESQEQTGLTREEKTALLNNIKFAAKQVADAKTNSEAKRLGKHNVGDVYGIIDEFFKGVWNNKDNNPDPTTGSYKTMGVLQVTSFQQNEKAAEKLVATGNKRFTHTKGGKWANAFPQILAKTRNYMKMHPASKSPAIRTELIIADSSSEQDMNRAAEAVGGVIVTRQRDEKFHYGNPFSHNSKWGIVTGNGTVEDAVKAFDAWLAGTDYKDVEPERRQWILDTINSGMLDDVPLVYYTSNVTDSTGTHAYNYNTFPNHAHILLKYINMHIAYPLDNIERFASPLQAKATLESEKTILTNEELASWNEQGIVNPRILVADERTDPAFFADELIDIIEGRQKAKGAGVTANKYSGKDFNALYIITKHDGAPIRKILQTKIPKIIHFSVTGLGGTVWEPRVMEYHKMLDKIQSLIKDGLDPKCVTVRIDPIVPGVTLMADIEEIIKRSSQMGIKRIKFSVCDMYTGNTQILPDGRKRIKPAAWVPALERTEQQYGKQAKDALWNTLVQAYGTRPNKPHMLNFHAYPERIYSICDRVVQIGEKYGVKLSTCAETINHPKVSKEGCLSVAQVNELLGTSIEDKGTANNNYRAACTCFGGKVDAFDYTYDCASICGYCYGGHANDQVDSQKLKETHDEKNVLTFDKDLLKQMGAKVLKHCNKNI